MTIPPISHVASRSYSLRIGRDTPFNEAGKGVDDEHASPAASIRRLAQREYLVRLDVLDSLF